LAYSTQLIVTVAV